MVSLTWSQVQTWRLSQHSLLALDTPKNLSEVVSRIGGAQAQLMSAAEWSLGTRIEGLRPADVQDALWRDRTLIKTWAMRGTLHLMAATDLPLLVAARRAITSKRPPSYYKYHGVTSEGLDAILEAIPRVLSAEPITREQLARAVAERAAKPELREVLLSGWGALLKPSAFLGDICFGPNQGQNVTFVRPSQWIPGIPEITEQGSIDPQEALKEMARRYLRVYGPATSEDFARWWGIQPAPAKRVFRLLGDEVEEVNNVGHPAWALAETLAQMENTKSFPSAKLLPQFDALTVGISRDCEPILPAQFKSRVYRPQGWIAAVVLIDGRVEGTWEYQRQRSEIVLEVSLFGRPSEQIEQGIRAEARRLGEFLESEVELLIN